MGTASSDGDRSTSRARERWSRTSLSEKTNETADCPRSQGYTFHSAAWHHRRQRNRAGTPKEWCARLHRVPLGWLEADRHGWQVLCLLADSAKDRDNVEDERAVRDAGSSSPASRAACVCR